MISINSILSPKSVLLSPEVKDKTALIRMLIDSLEISGTSVNKELLFRDVMERESLSSTGLDYGCAVPHAQSEALNETVMAAAILREGIDFNSPDGLPARLVFLIAGPGNQASQHLKLLSRMARILHDSEFLETLEKVDSVSEFLDLIKKRED